MRLNILALSLLSGLSFASATTFAEPAVQAGETLESLSQAKVTTTVNGQPGSLDELLSSGQIKLVNQGNVTTDATDATDGQNPADSSAATPENQHIPVEPAAISPTDQSDEDVQQQPGPDIRQ